MPGNPLGQETAGRDRITITTTKGDPAPIPPELLRAWWRAAERAPSQVASDYYRFQLLTGCGAEIHGHKLHGYACALGALAIRIRTCRCLGALATRRIILADRSAPRCGAHIGAARALT